MLMEAGLVADFEDILYKGQCKFCEDKLGWEASFDADGTDYYAECCDTSYWFSPHTVMVGMSENDDEEEGDEVDDPTL